MLKLERTNVMNIENAVRGARNPMNSWAKSDSYYGCKASGKSCDDCIDKSGEDCNGYRMNYILGPNDLDLARRLCTAGPDHRKFIRQVFVSVDITAPLYWWKEFDTYKVGTTANSCSTMHKIQAKEFTREDFSCEHMTDSALKVLDYIITELEDNRNNFNLTKDKVYWYNMIQLLPTSYNQMRTCTMTYENLRNMYQARKNHKLDEWHVLCDWVEKLPYFNEMIKSK